MVYEHILVPTNRDQRVLHESVIAVLCRKTGEQQGLPGANWKLLKCVALLFLGVTVFATALTNISLAFFITLGSAPVVVTCKPTSSR